MKWYFSNHLLKYISIKQIKWYKTCVTAQYTKYVQAFIFMSPRGYSYSNTMLSVSCFTPTLSLVYQPPTLPIPPSLPLSIFTTLCSSISPFLSLPSSPQWPLPSFLASIGAPRQTHKSKHPKLGSLCEREHTAFVFSSSILSANFISSLFFTTG